MSKSAAASRSAKFVIGFSVGVLLGWGGGQFMQFDTGADLLIYLSFVGAFFGAVSALTSEDRFLRFLSWFC